MQDGQIINLTCFVSRLITNGTLAPDEEILDTIIKTLTEMVDKPLSLRDHQEREQAWLDLMASDKLRHFAPKDLLEMAVKSKCYRVAEILYEQSQKYSEILNCYLLDVHRENEVFNYMRQHAEDISRCIRPQLIKNIAKLIEIDGTQTALLVNEYYPELLEELCEKLKDTPEKMFILLYEVQLSDTPLEPELAERYLELLCSQNPNAVENFIKAGNCRPEHALVIAQRARHNAATAYFLEQIGDFNGALDLFLEDPTSESSILQAASLCARGASHLDQMQAQELWLKLLKKCSNQDILRQILHSAAQYVHLSTLLDVINTASLGDIKNLLQGLLADSAHETLMLTTTYKLLGNDLHQGLAKSLVKGGQGISVKNTNCNICQMSLIEDETVAVFSCSHCFHDRCMITNSSTVVSCPTCHKTATLITLSNPKNQPETSKRTLRPDLEGLF